MEDAQDEMTALYAAVLRGVDADVPELTDPTFDRLRLFADGALGCVFGIECLTGGYPVPEFRSLPGSDRKAAYRAGAFSTTTPSDDGTFPTTRSTP